MLNVRKAKTLLSAHYAHMLEYRAEIFLWALSNSLPIILMGVWIEASQNGDFDFSPQEFARYFFSVLLVRQYTTIWVLWDFEREIVEGKLSLRLLQPIDPVWPWRDCQHGYWLDRTAGAAVARLGHVCHCAPRQWRAL